VKRMPLCAAPIPRQILPKIDKMITLRNQQVILDSDVAELYDVETRDINKAVKNNPSKFPNGYIIELDATEKHELVEIFHRFERQKHSTVNPKAFTEKGLCMFQSNDTSQRNLLYFCGRESFVRLVKKINAFYGK
jgi:hypothetical protein